MTGVIILLHLLNFERVPAGGGLGWDGQIYAEMIRDGTPGNVYYAGRIFPTLLLAPFGSTTMEVIQSFVIWNLLALLLSVFVWERIGDRLSLSAQRRWLGFAGIFCTFLLKQTLYYPVLVDVTALTVALLLFLFHLEKRVLAVALTAMAGAFCWPLASFTGAALICCSGGKEIVPRKILLIGIAAVSLLAIPVWLWPIPGYEQRSLGLATALPSLALFGAFAAILGVPALRRLWLGAIIIVLPLLIQHMIADPSFHAQRGTGVRLLLHYILTPHQVGMVFLPFVSLAVYFGPFFIAGLLRWRDVASKAKELGIGTVILIHLPLGLVTEPRYWIMVWPFVAVSLLLAVDLSRKQAVIFGVLCLIYSRIWLPINLAPWPPGDEAGLDQFPKQMWFTHYGFWMSWPSFLLNFALSVAAAGILFWLLLGPNRSNPQMIRGHAPRAAA